MKRFLAVVVLIVIAFLFFTSATMAGEKKRTRKTSSSHVMAAKTIVVGLWVWGNHGADKYRDIEKPVTTAQLIGDIKGFKDMSDEDKRLLINEVILGHKKLASLAYGDILKEMYSKSGLKGSSRGVLVGGKKDVLEAVWKYEAKKSDGSSIALYVPFRCHNTAWGLIVPKPPRQEPPKPEEPPTVVIPPFEKPPQPPEVVIPPTEKEPPTEQPPVPQEGNGILNAFEELEVYVGGGAHTYVNWSADGRYAWGKIRFRPFENDLWDGWKIKYGAFASGTLWEGYDKSGKHAYQYAGGKFSFGPSLKIHDGSSQEFNADIGIGKIWNSGGVEKYENSQKGNIFTATLSYDDKGRRIGGEKSLPRWGVYLDMHSPLGEAKMEQSWDGEPIPGKPFNEAWYEVGFQQGLYDFEPGNLRVTPGFNLAYGYRYGHKLGYYKLGPNVIVAWNNYDILNVNFLNYEEELGKAGDKWHWIGGYVDVSGLIKAYKASGISAASEDDINARRSLAVNSR